MSSNYNWWNFPGANNEGLGSIGTQNPSSTTAPAASSGSATNGVTGPDTSWSDIAKAIAQMYGAYSASQGPKFSRVPEDPALTALRARVLGFIDKSPTRDMFGQMVGQRMQQNNAHPFMLPPAKYGYQPYAGGTGQTQYDMSKILPTLFGGGAGATAMPDPNSPAGAVGGSSSPGDRSMGQGPTVTEPSVKDPRVPNMAGNTGTLIGAPGAGVFDPNMQGRDPNVNPNIPQSPYGSPSGPADTLPINKVTGDINDPRWLTSVGVPQVAGSSWWQNYTQQHPNWKSDLTGAASVVAGAMGNSPISVALKIVQMLTRQGAH